MAEYITEFANDIAKSCPDLVENGCGNDNCVGCLAFKLIGLGYQKQSNTADVAPKSEVAREIFEEIEKLSYRFMNDEHYIFGDMVWDISELKKKYTGVEESEGL